MAANPRANEITKALSGTNFPASRDALENLPHEQFNTMADVEKAYGQET